MDRQMKLRYSEDVDAIYVYLDSKRRRIEGTESIPSAKSERLVDYTKDGTPVGIEILGTKNGIDVSGLPRAEEVAELLRAHGFTVLAGSGAA